MDTMMILYLVTAFLVGVGITFLVLKKNNASLLSHLSSENDKLQSQLSGTELRMKHVTAEATQKNEQIKRKYESLLKEANVQCEKLDRQLKSALDGILDDSFKEQLHEVDKLKNTIKDLEEELEENEDDLSEMKKKIKNKDAEFEDLQSNFDREQKKARMLHDELIVVKQTLDDKVEELKLKMGSLDFIQEILSAKEISTEDASKLHKNINFLESFIKGEFTDLISALSPYLPWRDEEGKARAESKKKYFYNAFEQWASTKRKSWLDGKTTVAFVGEFSAGKTSIVNRILSQDNPHVPKLPVSTKATTAIPTYIAGGSTVSYSFISGDAKQKVILEDTFKKVSKDILDQIKGTSSLIKYFVMTYKNPNLKGLSILDTPGFNSNDKEDRERTIDVINECDALFWVFDVNAGTVNRSSISIIKEKLNKPLYVVINKVDTKAESEVQKVENLIKKTLFEEGLEVQQFIRFSANAPLENIMNPIKSVTKISTRDTFLDEVNEDFKAVLGIFDENLKVLGQRYHDLEQGGEDLSANIIGIMQALKSDCEEASSIPQWVEHIFSKDRFEMTASEGNHLIGLLEQIVNTKVPALDEEIEKHTQNALEQEQAWQNMNEYKSLYLRIQECYEQYKKVVKNIA